MWMLHWCFRSFSIHPQCLTEACVPGSHYFLCRPHHVSTTECAFCYNTYWHNYMIPWIPLLRFLSISATWNWIFKIGVGPLFKYESLNVCCVLQLVSRHRLQDWHRESPLSTYVWSYHRVCGRQSKELSYVMFTGRWLIFLIQKKNWDIPQQKNQFSLTIHSTHCIKS